MHGGLGKRSLLHGGMGKRSLLHGGMGKRFLLHGGMGKRSLLHGGLGKRSLLHGGLGRGPYYMEGWGRGPYYRLVLCVVSWQVAMVDCGIAEQLLGIVNQEQLKQALDIIVQLLKNGSHIGFIFFVMRGRQKTKGCGVCWDEVSREVGFGEGERE